MELKKIKELLEKYFEARTTSEEERLLSDYFSGSKIPEEFSSYKALFAFYKTEGAQGIQPAQQQPIKNKALEAILAGEEKRKRLPYWTHAAAIAIFMLATYVPARQYYQKQQAKIAYQETLKAFALLANNYNKATAAVGYLETFEAAKSKIYNP